MFRFALKNLLSRPVRSLLALCGLTVAIAGMVGLFAVAEGIDDTVSSTFSRIPGLTVMQPGAPIPLFSRLPTEWGDEIAGLAGVRTVHPEVWTRAHIIDGKPSISPPRFLFGLEPARYAQVKHSVYIESLVEGRVLTPDDRGTHNCLVSRAISDQYKKRIGETLRVDGFDVTIVGIYDCHSLFLDVAIILDIEQVREMGRFGNESVSCFYVEPADDADLADLSRRIRELFHGRSPQAWQPSADFGFGIATGDKTGSANPLVRFFQNLHRAVGGTTEKNSGATHTTDAAGTGGGTCPSGTPATPAESAGIAGASTNAVAEEQSIEVRSSDDWATQFSRFSEDLDIFLTIMTSIGVIIAVLGIVNTMLMSVTERFIEFGILKANGWSNGDVLWLITFESALLGLGGGVFGAWFGWVATLAINARWPTRIHLYASPTLLAFSLLFSIVVGILGGLYPAWWASRMSPMEAIRRG
jgi:putative ABC transport system permease protein